MSTVSSFDTKTVRPWNNPLPDTFATVDFPCPYLAPPRLPHGLRQLDIDHRWNIRVRGTIENIQNESAVYHVTTWFDTKVYSGILDSLNLAPANLDILCGEHRRDPHSWRSPGADVHINFERPFVTPPKAVIFFNAFDLNRSRNWRLSTIATNIDEKGFMLNINTWGDTILYYAQAGWIANPKDRENTFSTSVSTRDVRPPKRPQLNQGKAISFDNVDFSKYPNVFAALNQFDIDCSAGFRLDAYVDNVSTKGLTWHIDSWAGTILYSAAVTNCGGLKCLSRGFDFPHLH